ncbi:hypothetical protein ACFLY7_00760 [Patescibacteria group bacterium]
MVESKTGFPFFAIIVKHEKQRFTVTEAFGSNPLEREKAYSKKQIIIAMKDSGVEYNKVEFAKGLGFIDEISSAQKELARDKDSLAVIIRKKGRSVLITLALDTHTIEVCQIIGAEVVVLRHNRSDFIVKQGLEILKNKPFSIPYYLATPLLKKGWVAKP